MVHLADTESLVWWLNQESTRGRSINPFTTGRTTPPDRPASEASLGGISVARALRLGRVLRLTRFLRKLRSLRELHKLATMMTTCVPGWGSSKMYRS